MSMKTLAVAMACTGLIAAPLQAQASPAFPAPMAPSTDCDWIVFATDSDIDQRNGTVVHVAWGTSGGEASYPAGGRTYSGSIGGPLIIKGTNELDFSVTFSPTKYPFGDDPIPTPTNSYSGFIDPAGTASGTWRNDSGASGTWTMGSTFRCIGKAPDAEQAPPPAPSGKPIRCTGGRMLPPGSDCSKTPAPDAPADPTVTSATITGDVNIYKFAGGVGEPYDMVRAGTVVEVKVRQPDNWVNIAGADVPGGSGWVWGDFVSQ